MERACWAALTTAHCAFCLRKEFSPELLVNATKTVWLAVDFFARRFSISSKRSRPVIEQLVGSFD